MPFEKAQPFDVYHSIIVVDPSLPNHLKHIYAGILIRHRADMILRLIATNYLIENIYTVTITREGDRLAQGLGFQRIEGKSLVRGRIAYKYTIDERAIEHLEKLSGRGK